MALLVLVRHGESQWNLENRFTGWVDIPLSERGQQEAREAGEKLRGIHFDKGFTSVLQRAIATLEIILEVTGQKDLPVERDQALNERHYGDLQGLNKAETAAKFCDEQVKLWLPLYSRRPPNGESLEDTAARVLPYYDKHILPESKAGKKLLNGGPGNNLGSPAIGFSHL